MSINQRYRIGKSVQQSIPLKDVDGGFPLAALAPFAIAAGIPLANEAGKWIGRKVFGKGLHRSGNSGFARAGAGVLRSGDTAQKHEMIRAANVPLMIPPRYSRASIMPANKPLYVNPLLGVTKGGSILSPEIIQKMQVLAKKAIGSMKSKKKAKH